MHRQYKKSKKNIIMILYLVLLIIISLSGCKGDDNNRIKSELDLDQAMELIENNMSEIDYNQFVKIVMKESQLVFNKTNSEQKEDGEFNNLVYEIHIQNTSNENINLYTKFFIPKELTSSIITSRETFDEQIDLDPNKGIRIRTGVVMKHYNTLSDEEKKLFNSLKDTLFLEIKVNNKSAYTKINTNKTE